MTYWSGTPCAHGHESPRYTNTGNCQACCNIANAATYARMIQDPDYKKKHRGNAANWKKKNNKRVRAVAKEWAKANATLLRNARREWRKRNPDKVKKYGKDNRTKHREAISERLRTWNAANPDRVKFHGAVRNNNRRARVRGNGGSFTIKDIEHLYAIQHGKCAVCPQTEGLEIDHVLPILLGGSSYPANLQLLCRPCNRAKGSKHPDLWREELRIRSLSLQR